MKYTITGTRMEAISITIEADDIDEAMAKALAEEFSGRDVDVWDSTYTWDYAMLNPDEVFNSTGDIRFEDSDYGYDY